MQLRRDVQLTSIFDNMIAWGIRMKPLERDSKERLIVLHSLRERTELPSPLRYLPTMTHEFTVYDLDASSSIDFDKSLWKQPTLRPVKPARVGFQFKAGSDAEAATRVQKVIDQILLGRARVASHVSWLEFFPDGFDVSQPLLDLPYLDAPIMRPPSPKAVALAARKRGVPSFLPPLAEMFGRRVAQYTFALGLMLMAGAVCIPGSRDYAKALADGSERIHMAQGDTFDRHFRFPDGTTRHVLVTHAAGVPNLYNIVFPDEPGFASSKPGTTYWSRRGGSRPKHVARAHPAVAKG
jgi:hypothetical protein